MTTTTATKDGLSIRKTRVLQNQTRKSTENGRAATVVAGGARLVTDDDDDDDGDGDSDDGDDKEESLTAFLFPIPPKGKPPTLSLLSSPSPPTSPSSTSLIIPAPSSSSLTSSLPPPPPPPPPPVASSSSSSSPSSTSPQRTSLPTPPKLPSTPPFQCQNSAALSAVFPSSSSSSSSSSSLPSAAASRQQQQLSPPSPPPPPPPSPPSPLPKAEVAATDMAALMQPFDVQPSLTGIDSLRAQEKEQSAVIMALKNELDNRCCQLKTMEKVNEELNMFKTEAEKQKMVRAAEILAIERDFQQLSKRHDRLLKVKNSVKEKNELLEERIAKMSIENPSKLSKVLKEKSLLVQQLNRSVSRAKLRLRQLETVYSQKLFERENNSELERAKLLQSVHLRTKYELEKKIESAKTEMEDHQRTLKETTLEKLKNEEERLRKRDQLIRYVEEAAKRTEKLSQRIKEVKEDNIERDKVYLELKKKFMAVKGGIKAQEWKIDKEINIKELKRQLATLKTVQNEATKAFLAYKRHTDHLINRERTLNKRFSEINGKYAP